jgi:hypothetical protein
MNSTEPMALAYNPCDIAGDPDIVGIGVTTLPTSLRLTVLQIRVAIFLPAITAAVLCAFIDFVEADTFLSLVLSCVGIGLALFITAFLYQIKNTLTQYHAYMILHLAFMNVPASWAILIWRVQAKLQGTPTGKLSIATIFCGVYAIIIIVFACTQWVSTPDSVGSENSRGGAPGTVKRNGIYLACEMSFASGEKFVYERFMVTSIGLAIFVSLVLFLSIEPEKPGPFRADLPPSAAEGLSETEDPSVDVASETTRCYLVWTWFGRFLLIAIPIVSFVLIEATEYRNQSRIVQYGVENQWNFSQIFVMCCLIAEYVELVRGCL